MAGSAHLLRNVERGHRGVASLVLHDGMFGVASRAGRRVGIALRQRDSVNTAREDRLHFAVTSAARRGDVELVDVDENGVVKVKLTGACAGCPMSQMTLKWGVENYLKKKIPEVKSVESV